MNHIKIYKQLIMNRICNPVKSAYKERHHIVPKSEGGSDDADNVVNLTAREHYIAHLLLAKIYDDKKMHSAVIYMQTNHNKNRVFKFNSRLYEKMREEYRKKISGKNHWNYGKPAWNSGKHGIYSDETRRKISDGTKKALSNPEIRKHISEALKGKCFWKEDTKQHMSAKFSGRGNPFYNHTHSEEAKQKMSKAQCGEKNPNYGKHLSEETREKISKANKCKKRSLEQKKKISEGTKAAFTEEVKAKMSSSLKGRKAWNKGVHGYHTSKKGTHLSEEVKSKISNTITGSKWYNNGVIERQAKECPPGYVPGRIKKKKQ